MKLSLVAERGGVCPVCGSKTRIEEYYYEAASGEELVLVVEKCPSCGYKRTENVPLREAGKPGTLRIVVDKSEKLNKLIYRSPTATVRIPELGVEISPGPYSHGYLTTIEGVLARIEEVLSLFGPAGREASEKLRCMREGRLAFTLEIEDPEGASKLLE